MLIWACTGLPPLAPGELIERGDGHSVRMAVNPNSALPQWASRRPWLSLT